MNPEEHLRMTGRISGMADAIGLTGSARFVDEVDEEFWRIYEDDQE